jgi:hypothetical protein
MAKISFNSIPTDVLKVNSGSGSDRKRADLVALGRLLTIESANKGVAAVRAANNNLTAVAEPQLTPMKYKEANEKFRDELFVYAARKACEMTGEEAPSSFDEFKRQSLRWYGNANLYRVLQGIITEIVSPIIPTIYSEAVDYFADVIEVGFGETEEIVVTSNEIPVFQDTAWGAQRSTPANYFYDKTYKLSPKPRTAEIKAKWFQLISNNTDFGRFMANLAAGLYAKTLGLWQAQMAAAINDTTLVPTDLSVTFNATNWVKVADRLAALNATTIDNIVAYGAALPLSKVLPTNVTGSTNADMDAAIATLLGSELVRSGYLGQFYRVRLMPLQNAIVPNTIDTVLADDVIYMLASNARKPMTIAYNRDTPLTLEIDPAKSGDMEMGINMTIAVDAVSVFADHIAVVNI